MFQRFPNSARGFTLIEVLVTIAIIGVLVSILIPSLSKARALAKSTICLTRLRTFGQGMILYANVNGDIMPPARMPKVDKDRWRIRIEGGMKYRPTFLAMMAHQVGLQPFEEPLASRDLIDKFHQPGDRQNYDQPAYLCPEVPEWVDERNGAYGYNYQFLGNARLLDRSRVTSYKNWANPISRVKAPSECVAIGDAMGTAASFRPFERTLYEDNEPGRRKTGRTLTAFGNEGFNLDPPRVDAQRGEMAGFGGNYAVRTAVHMRHANRGNVLWVDGHASSETLGSLGYEMAEDGHITFDGDNRLFNINHVDEAWVEE
jgi:prepilin-type N-terminal cleavage/methylation domain-containing protein/prepilin-type processing-associated H-X9-DG protein